MRLLPYDRLTLRTEQLPDAVQAKLAAIVAKPRWLSFRAPPQPFRGTVEGRRFKIIRVLRGFRGRRNSWQPLTIGEIVPAPFGTEVRLRMRLPAIVTVFMLVWFGGAFIMAVALLLGGSRLGFGSSPGSGPDAASAAFPAAAICAAMLVAYTMISISFWSEVRKAKILLSECLGCKEAKPESSLVRQ